MITPLPVQKNPHHLSCPHLLALLPEVTWLIAQRREKRDMRKQRARNDVERQGPQRRENLGADEREDSDYQSAAPKGRATWSSAASFWQSVGPLETEEVKDRRAEWHGLKGADPSDLSPV